MDTTNTAASGRTSRSKPAASTENADASAPHEMKLPRAVHELRTGADPDDKIDGGTIITETLAELHGLDDKTLGKLVTAGAVELVDVLVR